MAIIACPYCGKKVTDRMVKCPHCQAVLTQQPEQKPISKEEIKVSVKGRIAGIAIATVLTMIAARLWSLVATIYVGRFMGDTVVAALGCATGAFFFSTFVLLLIEAVLLCLQPVLLKNIKLSSLLIAVFGAVVFAILGWFVQHHAVLLFVTKSTPEVLHHSQSFSDALGAAFPLLWSSLYIATHRRTFKKALLMQGVLTVIFLVFSIVLEVLLCVTFAMGTQGFSVAILISAAVVLGIALLSSKDIQQLIAPK